MLEFWSKNRGLLAVILGVLCGFMMVAFVEVVGHWLYPPDGLLDPNDPSSYQKYIEALPSGALLFVALAQTMGMLVASYVSTKVAPVGKNLPFIITAIIFLLAMISNFIMIPFHPVWLMLVSFIGAAIGAYLGRNIALRTNPTVESPKNDAA